MKPAGSDVLLSKSSHAQDKCTVSDERKCVDDHWLEVALSEIHFRATSFSPSYFWRMNARIAARQQALQSWQRVPNVRHRLNYFRRVA
jgi:hypothetical protein